MRLVWYFSFSPLLSGRVKEPFQPLFFVLQLKALWDACERISVLFLLERRESNRTSARTCPRWPSEAKFWLHPMVHLDNSSGFDARTLRELAEAVEQNATLIERAWNEHFG